MELGRGCGAYVCTCNESAERGGHRARADATATCGDDLLERGH